MSCISLRLRSSVLAAGLLFTGGQGAVAESSQRAVQRINLRHLNSLRRMVETPTSGAVPFWWIYCESARPDRPEEPYRHVEASGEGISCVDDVARAALVYLRHWHLSGDPESLKYAKECFQFLRYMKAPDGTYFNFLLPGGARNETRENSLPGLTWWTARAAWACGEGCRLLHQREPVLGRQLADDLKPTLAMLRTHLREQYGHFRVTEGRRIPAWLVHNGSDVTAVFVLALSAYEEAYPSPDTRTMIRQLAEAILLMQAGDELTYPWGAYIPNARDPASWHGWGSHETAALAVAGGLLKDERFIESAEQCASNITVHLLASDGPIYGFTPTPKQYEQIFYTVEPMVYGYLALYRVTKKPQYRELARLAASWMMGNNAQGVVMYDAKTGRGYDGIASESRINYNAGAESTIEALFSLLLLAEEQISLDQIGFRTRGGRSFQIIDIRKGGPQPVIRAGIYRVFAVVERNSGDQTRALTSKLKLNDHELGTLELTAGRSRDMVRLPGTVSLPQGSAHFEIGSASSNTKLRLVSIVLQPLVEYRVAEADNGQRWLLAKSWADEAVELDDEVTAWAKGRRVSAQSYSPQGRLVAKRRMIYRQGKLLQLPAHGYALVSIAASQAPGRAICLVVRASLFPQPRGVRVVFRGDQ